MILLLFKPRKKHIKRRKKDLHNVLRIPENGVSVEIGGGIEPKIELLLSVAFALTEHICVKYVRISAQVSQELEVNLIPC